MVSPEILSVLQIHCARREELDFFYQKNTALVAKDFHEHVDCFIDQAFSSSYILTPELKAIGYDAQLILANSSHSQIQWLHQYGFRDINADKWLEGIVRLQVSHYRPQVLLFSGVPTFDSKFLASLTDRPDLVLHWVHQSFSGSFEWGGFDSVLTTSEKVGEFLTDQGAKRYQVLLPGYPERVDIDLPKVDRTREIDICCLSSPQALQDPKQSFNLHQVCALADEHPELKYMLRVGDRFKSLYPDLPVETFPRVFGLNVYHTFRAAHLAFDVPNKICTFDASNPDSRTVLAKDDTVHEGIFQAAGSGAVIVAQANDALHSLFEQGKEIVTFSSLDELYESLTDLLESPTELEAMSKSARARCLKEHSLSKRANTLANLILDFFGSPASTTPESMVDHTEDLSSPSSVSNIYAHAFRGPLADEAHLYSDILKAISELHSGDPASSLARFESVLSTGKTPSPQSLATLGRVLSLYELGLADGLNFSLDSLNNDTALYNKARNMLPQRFFEENKELESGNEPTSNSALHPRLDASEETLAATPTAPGDEQTEVATTEIEIPVLEESFPDPSATRADHVDLALAALKDDDLYLAFQEIALAKQGGGTPVADADYVRALCFLKEERPLEAIYALREEIASFPDNATAKELIAVLQDQHVRPYKNENNEDKEFKALYDELRHHTTSTTEELRNLYTLGKQVCLDDIPGDFIDCGSGSGGAAILLADVIKKHSKRERKVFCFDTFSGLPAPGPEDRKNGFPPHESGWGEGTAHFPTRTLADLAEARSLTDQVSIMAGKFDGQIPLMCTEVSLVNIDAWWHASTLLALKHFYPLLAERGFLQISGQQAWEGVSVALEEFLKTEGVSLTIQQAGENTSWFKKPMVMSY